MRKPPNERLTRQPRTAAKAGGQPKRDSGPRPSPGNSHTPERTCILSREQGTRDSLVRLALGPDGQVFPDVRARAPGRGAWIGVDRAALEAAQSKGKLKAALTRAFKGSEVTIPADLGERIGAALRQNALDRLGLEARAGTLLTGSEKIEAAARRGEVHLLIHAADAGEDGRRKLDQAWRAGGGRSTPPPAPLRTGEAQGLVFPAERAILSLALGRQNVVHIALIDRAAAARVRHALDRWRAFIEPDQGLSATSAGTSRVSAVDVNEG